MEGIIARVSGVGEEGITITPLDREGNPIGETLFIENSEFDPENENPPYEIQEVEKKNPEL